jgi:hypothetical protein
LNGGLHQAKKVKGIKVKEDDRQDLKGGRRTRGGEEEERVPEKRRSD